MLCKAAGTFIIPAWVSSPFWPMLFGFKSPYHFLAEGIFAFTDVAGISIRGFSESIFDRPNLETNVLAVGLSGC